MNSMDETGGSIALGADGYIVKSDENLKAIPETIENILSK